MKVSSHCIYSLPDFPHYTGSWTLQSDIIHFYSHVFYQILFQILNLRSVLCQEVLVSYDAKQ